MANMKTNSDQRFRFIMCCFVQQQVLSEGRNERGFVALLAQHLTLFTVGYLLVEGFWKRRGFS